MKKTARYLPRNTLWTRASPLMRFFVGCALIILVGYLGLTPNVIFGIEIAWPHAALWGAVGWASAGLSVRIMLVLILLGIAQDLFFDAPIGVFAIVNLVTYAVAAILSQAFAVETEILMTIMVTGIAMTSGFFLLWILASAASLHAVSIQFLTQQAISTFIIFFVIMGLFRLGGLPGIRAGTS